MIRLCAILFALFPFSALGEQSLQFGSKGNILHSELHVYIDKTQPALRCVCGRFSVAVDDGESMPGKTRTHQILVVAKGEDGKVLEGSSTRELLPLWRMPNSPSATRSQFILMGHEGHSARTTIQVIGLKKRCLNPTEAECNEDVVSHYGEFKASELHKLAPISATDLMKQNR